MPHRFAAFYRGKRVLVIGHTGFTGGWLVAWLKLLGAKVSGYGLPPSSRPNFFDATLLDRGISSVFADVRERDTLANTFADFQPEIVIHAAQSRASHSSPNPVEIFETNVMGTINVLEEARLTGCARSVVVLNESGGASQLCDQKGAQASGNLLRSSQVAAELAALAFSDSFFRESRTGVAIARIPCLIGGGDWTESGRVLALIQSLVSGEPIFIHETSAVFYCLHVLEAARACLQLGERLFDSGPADSGAWDFTPADGEAISESGFAKKFVEHWGSGELHMEPPNSTNDAGAAQSNAGQRKITAGLTPALSLDEAMAWTIDWYKAYYADPASAWRTTEAQIEQYRKLPPSQPGLTATTISHQ
jgi:CDP-glucose 4,6-dehydratase